MIYRLPFTSNISATGYLSSRELSMRCDVIHTTIRLVYLSIGILSMRDYKNLSPRSMETLPLGFAYQTLIVVKRFVRVLNNL